MQPGAALSLPRPAVGLNPSCGRQGFGLPRRAPWTVAATTLIGRASRSWGGPVEEWRLDREAVEVNTSGVTRAASGFLEVRRVRCRRSRPAFRRCKEIPDHFTQSACARIQGTVEAVALVAVPVAVR